MDFYKSHQALQNWKYFQNAWTCGLVSVNSLVHYLLHYSFLWERNQYIKNMEVML